MIRFIAYPSDAIIASTMQHTDNGQNDSLGKGKFLLVASDIHDDESSFERLAAKACSPNCAAFLYAGDLNVENYFIFQKLKYRSFTFLPVLGNCDNPWAWTDAGVPQPPQFRTLSYANRTGELRIYMSHGHLHPYPSSVGLDDGDFELCITGHTHVNLLKTDILEPATPSEHSEKSLGNPLAKRKGKRLVLLNPGSPSHPRGGSLPSYAIVRIPEEGSALVEIRDSICDDLLSEMAVPLHKVEERNNRTVL